MGRKDSKKNPDGFFRIINELKMLKEAGKAGTEENSRASGNSSSKSARSRVKRRTTTSSEKGGRQGQLERN